ncbi:type II toxin-antitoxin system VapC family toxin [Salinibacterium sp. SYSU T00001]|uniref:type II toxin-antitoxin system VapC family toxin n=1 Tax=Homoserinimonas sedimenticola TaxID=2986805 RepID=UPI0022363406|nr:type II toxin-antitoxin system VapC family toxin [Salinibacterium sedimenticola]MCW4386467.1 type II toxin-antitoxin system VapC family toxin [Salinibacterium sedimenticola]
MIVLDSDVVSEVLKPQPDARVVAWLESLTDDVAITAVTFAELLASLRRLPDGRRKEDFTSRVEAAIRPYLDTGAIIPFDAAAASRYADILSVREAKGLPITTGDAQIAAICRSRDAICATRNTKNFIHAGVALINPWAGEEQLSSP